MKINTEQSYFEMAVLLSSTPIANIWSFLRIDDDVEAKFAE